MTGNKTVTLHLPGVYFGCCNSFTLNKSQDGKTTIYNVKASSSFPRTGKLGFFATLFGAVGFSTAFAGATTYLLGSAGLGASLVTGGVAALAVGGALALVGIVLGAIALYKRCTYKPEQPFTHTSKNI